MSIRWRRPSLLVAALVAGCLAAACSSTLTGEGEKGAVGSSGAGAAAIGITLTPTFITLENRAGLPLQNLKLTLRAMNGLQFSRSVSRLENGAKLDIAASELRGIDGTVFTLAYHRPKDVQVTATDIVGKNYDVTVPWR